MRELEAFLATIHPNTVTGALIYLALVLVCGVLGSLAIGAVARRALKKESVDHMAVAVLRPVSRIGLWLVLVVAYLHLIPVLRAMGTALLTGASVASIVLGVAAQSTLGNAIAGLALLIYRPFRVGDQLQVQAPGGPEMGTVESVTLGYTVLRTFDNRRVVLPNSLAGSQTTVNLSSVDPRVLASVHIAINDSADVALARKVLLELASSHPDGTEVVDCPLVALGDSSATLCLRAWCQDSLAVDRFEYELLESAKKRFEEEGVGVP